MSSSAAPLLREIRRITEYSVFLEQRQRRIDYALARAIAMLRERPERLP